ncbi:MAG: CoA pyrophosphatase [Deltaproteobacteria bacterium]|nr:CoA pyrophosphatase [Deltaproteobacteria bacterium]
MRREHLIESIAARLAEPPARTLEPEDRAPSAVLVPLFPDPPAGLSTLFTVRTTTVRDHKGQVSFPGGGRDEGDPDLLATVLREAGEELELARADVQILGRLDDLPTLTGYLIRPFVGYLRRRPKVHANPVEIERVLWAPLAALAAPGACRPRHVRSEGWSGESPGFEVDGEIVWGATARVLVNLLERIGPLLAR